MSTIPSPPDGNHPYVYALVRADLSIEQIAVQACHAVYEAGIHLPPGTDATRMIVCTVPDQAALLAAAVRLERNGVAHRLFFEPDNEVGYSALATEPLFAPARRLLAKYPLLYRPTGN